MQWPLRLCAHVCKKQHLAARTSSHPQNTQRKPAKDTKRAPPAARRRGGAAPPARRAGRAGAALARRAERLLARRHTLLALRRPAAARWRPAAAAAAALPAMAGGSNVNAYQCFRQQFQCPVVAGRQEHHPASRGAGAACALVLPKLYEEVMSDIIAFLKRSFVRICLSSRGPEEALPNAAMLISE